MEKGIISFLIAIVLFVIAYRLKAVHKNESLQMNNYKQTYATIERVVFSDTGNAKYYVSFSENDNKIIAQTDYYSSETKSLNPGDEVKIGYFFTKNGTPRADICDDRVISLSNYAPNLYRLLTIVGILLLLAAMVNFAKVMFF